MGMYTELNCAFRLKADTPAPIITLLLHMMDHRKPAPSPFLSIPF